MLVVSQWTHNIVSPVFKKTTYILIRILQFLRLLLGADPSFPPLSIGRAEFVQVATMKTFLPFQRGPARALGAPVMATVQFGRLGKPLNRVLKGRGQKKKKKRQLIDFKKVTEVCARRNCPVRSPRYLSIYLFKTGFPLFTLGCTFSLRRTINGATGNTKSKGC